MWVKEGGDLNSSPRGSTGREGAEKVLYEVCGEEEKRYTSCDPGRDSPLY